MNKKNFICIVCPRGCHLEVERKEDGEIEVSNHQCNRGIDYGKTEFTNPTRMLTTTVVIEGANFSRLPVISKEEIPKDKLPECLDELYKISVKSPIKCGDVILENVCNTGVDIMASIDM